MAATQLWNLWRNATGYVAGRLWSQRAPRPEPALPVEDSVTANFLVCLETGTRHVTLTRHLQETLRMTPAEYRRRWRLPADYPMVAQNYLARRDEIREEA